MVAALNASVFPLSFSFPLLIIIYTMVILGGAGSQGGVVIGAVLIGILLEVLRDPGDSRVLFYSVIVVGLVAALRLSWQARRGARRARSGSGSSSTRSSGPWMTPGPTAAAARVAAWPTSWPTGSSCPATPADWIAPVSYVSLVALALLLTLLKGWVRLAVLVPVLYLAAFVWENVMLAKPEPTRYIILGVLLIALMIARPSGLLGEKRVEII